SLWIAAITTVVFTALARFIRGVSRSGAVAGAVICFTLIASAGLGAFIGLISVFALTWIATRFGYRRKQILGIAERPEGRKSSREYRPMWGCCRGNICRTAWVQPPPVCFSTAFLALRWSGKDASATMQLIC